MNRRVRFLGGPDEDVDEMLAASVDERGDRLRPPSTSRRPPIKGKPSSAKSVTGGTKSSLPSNQGLTVCWSVEATSVRWPGLQRTNVRVNDFRG